MNNIFENYKPKYVTVKIDGIIWCSEDDDGEIMDVSHLPISLNEFVVECEGCVDPYEKWREDGGFCGYNQLCEDLAEQLSDEYGFLVSGFDLPEVLKVEQN